MIIYTKTNKRQDELHNGKTIWRRKLDDKKNALLDVLINYAKKALDGFTSTSVIYCVDYIVFQCKNKEDFLKIYPQFSECLLSFKIDNNGEKWDKVDKIVRMYGITPYPKGKSIAEIGKSSGGWYRFGIDNYIVVTKKKAIIELINAANNHNSTAKKEYANDKKHDEQREHLVINKQSVQKSPITHFVGVNKDEARARSSKDSGKSINTKELVGKRVNHTSKYGIGSIVDYISNNGNDYVCIKFDNEAEIKKYLYPTGFNQFLTIIDSVSNELPKQNQQEQNNESLSAERIDSTSNSTSEKTKNTQTVLQLLFTKTVDWSLLHYGFTVPMHHTDVLFKVLGTQLNSAKPRNNITLSLNNIVYHAKIYWSNGTTQVRWTPEDKIAKKLRSIFFRSYEYLRKQREYSKRNKKYDFGRKPVEFLDIMTDGVTGCVNLVPSMPGNTEKLVSITTEQKPITGIQTTLYSLQEIDNQASMFESDGVDYTSQTNSQTVQINKSNDLVGKRVRLISGHDEGTIIKQILNYVTVLFDSNKKTRIFTYPNSVGRYIEFIDEKAAKSIIQRPETVISKPVLERKTDRTGISSKIEHIITEKFKNGYRISKSIDFERFSNYYTEEYGEKPNFDARALDRSLSGMAVLFDERAYIYDDEAIATVREYLNQTGSPCISVQSFYEQHSDKLLELRIYSTEMLKTFIEKYYDDISCKYNYVYLQADVSPTEMVRDAFNERETWSLDELYERFPNLNQDTIRQMMARNEFIRVETGVYTHTNNLDLPYSEGQKIIDYIEEKLDTNEYILANELDLTHLLYLNPHCSYDTMRDIVFDKFLSGLFNRSGQIITRPGKKTNTLDILEQYCRDADTVTLQELSSLEASLDSKGRGHSACLAAANNIMVRVSYDLFVNDNMVTFDVDSIDEIIALYCPSNFIPLKSVTDFSLFPFTGYPWNLFLLESFVRRHSRLFKYDVRADNSSNVGAIVRKSFNYVDYDDILSVALANATLSLHDKNAILDFMYDKGFIARKTLGNSENKIIGNAVKLREGASA